MNKSDENIKNIYQQKNQSVKNARPKDTINSKCLEQHIQRIRLAAYYRAERRSFEAGTPESDWLQAEREILAQYK